MAKITEFKRLIREDFPEKYHDLIDKLAFALNPTLEQTKNALSNGLDFINNLNSQVKELDITVNSAGIPKSPTSFKSTVSGSCKGIWCIRADNLTSSITYPSSCPFISFSQSNDQVIIDHISGLQADNKYRLRLVVISY